MVLNGNQSVSILYNLAMTMAGETRPRTLATAVLQRLMAHTGCACGTVALQEPGAAPASRIYVAIGNKALRALEGKAVAWPGGVLDCTATESAQGWFPGGARYRHALCLELPALGHVLLFSARPPEQADISRRVLAPILAKFARSLHHSLKSEANLQALTENEANLRGMLEATPDWVWRVDRNGVYTFSSARVFDLLGYQPEEVIGKTPFDFMPVEEARRVGEIFAGIAATHAPFHSLENINLHKDGRAVVLETGGTPMFDADGNFAGYHGIDRDITARKQVQEELSKSFHAAEAANRAKNLFLSSISHELRTPLNAILGYAQLIEMEEGRSPETAAKAGEIRQAGHSLLGLLNEILDFAHIESGQMEMQVETFALAEVIDACIDQNAGVAAWKKVPINCAADCDQCCITADRRGLLQVLNHLVSNAVKFNREGGEVSISCSAHNRRLRIAVTDTGPGIDPAQQSDLFQPFNRAGAEMGGIAGVGIGLAVVRQQVERMGGTIGVESVPGQGSTFWVEIPSPTAEAAASSCQLMPEPAAPATVPPPPPRFAARVLVAEDYLPNQTLLQIQLSNLGCQVDIAADGAEALAMWDKAPYDLLLTDLNMPVMNGLALAGAIRQREAGSGRRTPIVCITAAATAAEMKQCTDAGVDATLTKPITLEGLRDALARWTAAPASADSEDAVLDLDCLYRILGETNPAQGRKLLATFIDSARSGLERLGAGSDSAAVALEMHKQKSSARTVGALRYAKQAAALEERVRDGGDADVAALLAALREELAAVENASAIPAMGQRPASAQGPVFAGFESLLVVDDDPVVLQQMSHMLTSLGAREVLTAGSGFDALRLLNERNGRLDTMICDLNMPGMDGVELIRLFGRTGFKGGLILMSGADEKVLSTAGKLADLQGLRVLGQLMKPVTPAQMAGLLSQANAPRVRKRQLAVMADVSAKDIRGGIDRDEFTIWFQPKVDVASLRPVGVEALARWQHPARGILTPDTFIAVAEREGLVGELSQILTSKALMQGARLHESGFPLTVAVNLSGLWLDDLRLPDFILATTQAAGLHTRDVVLEVTETGVMKDLATALDVLTRLRLKGFGLSIDDFGIGYSSFEQLDRIPFTELKLDRSFVSKGAQDATARAILQSSMDMARRMSLSTVAEGVETEADLELVRKMGCELAQGFLIAKPMPIKDLAAWLRRSPGNAHAARGDN